MTNMAPSGQTSPSATLDCPTCHTTITYYDVSGSSYYGCPNCHAFFKYEDEGPPDVLATFPKTMPSFVLPIGAEGYLNEQFVRVVGFMHRKETGASYNWVEYKLLQPDGRYVQLAEYNGHWTLIEPVKGTYTPFHAGGNAYYVDTDARRYRLYNRYRADVLNAVGEFDWNILDDEKLTISEYIQPPYMLVGEEEGKRSDWYIGRYLSRSDVASAFSLSENALPDPYGVGAIEPADPKDRAGTVLMFTSMVTVAILILQLIIAGLKPSTQLLNQSYIAELDSAAAVKLIVTPSFDVEGPTALAFMLKSTVDNQWLELPVELINEQSGRIHTFTKTLEYYHGVEGGENWSEGSQEKEAVLSRIPSGRYHLNLYPAREPGQPLSFSIAVRQNTSLLSNAIVLLVLLAIYPIVLYARRGWYESQRWTNSDFADVQEEN